MYIIYSCNLQLTLNVIVASMVVDLISFWHFVLREFICFIFFKSLNILFLLSFIKTSSFMLSIMS